MAQIDKLLELLIRTGASDLHIAVNVPPILRINGKLKRLDYPPLTREQTAFLLTEIMTEAQKASFFQDLDIDFAYEVVGLGRFRVNAFNQKNGQSAVFRVVPTRIPSPDDIKLPAAVRQLGTLEKGLILVTGPTGSGKSTTLAVLVDIINSQRHSHILTLEDPIEFVHESKKSLVSQREIGPHATSFARALRAALREDPDVILVGEMRDVETIQLAITAAETGHLVLSTLHTTSAPKTIDRIVDAFPSEQQEQIRTQLATALRAIIAQSLIPTIDGKGRVAAFEVLICNSAVANTIRERKTHMLRNIMQTGRAAGMQTMESALVDLVRRKLIDPKEAMNRASDPRAIEQEIGKLMLDN